MDSARPPVQNNGPSQDTAAKYLDLYLGLYKHHFELFLKGLALYLGIIGGTAAYVYRDGAATSARVPLSVFVIFVSLLAAGGCMVSLEWVSSMDRIITRLSTAVGLEPFPMRGARGIVMTVMLGAVVVLLLSSYNLWLGLRS